VEVAAPLLDLVERVESAARAEVLARLRKPFERGAGKVLVEHAIAQAFEL
jgi:hypothetical protein